MKFFNPQEDVLDIQLTQEGKRSLAKGKFKPSYYAFFDTDVLYDDTYAGTSEAQNDTQPRILDNTPRLKAQYLHGGVEADFKKLKLQRLQDKKIDNQSTDRAFQRMPVGTSTGNEYLPAWKIAFGEGEIKSAVLHHSASWGISFVPQLSSSLEIHTRVEFDESLAVDTSPQEASTMNLTPGRPLYDPDGNKGVLSTEADPDVYPDGSYLITEQSSILLDVAELNNDFVDENFEIEIFEIITQTTGGSETKEVLRPLKFISSEGYGYKNEKEISEEVKLPDNGHVQHYVDLFADGELDTDALDKFSGRKKNIVPGVGVSPYGPAIDIDPDDLKEPC